MVREQEKQVRAASDAVQQTKEDLNLSNDTDTLREQLDALRTYVENGGVYQAAMDRLLEEGDYVRPRKRQNGVVGAISSIYWLTVTAAYLLWTFGPWWDAQPQDTWILWAVAGVLYGAVMALVRGIRK